MVTELGMSDRIGPINYAERQGSDFLGTELMRGRAHSEETAREIDQEIQGLMTSAYKRAEEIVRSHREAVERLAQALLTWETVSGKEITRLMQGESIEDLRPGGPPVEQVEPRRSAPGVPPKPASEGKPGELPGEPGLSPA
jgi:cell division protease FtsH